MSLTKEDLLEVLDSVLSKKEIFTDEKHQEHHAFIQAELDRRRRSIERWEKFQSSLIGGIALAVLAGLGWIGTLILEWVRRP